MGLVDKALIVSSYAIRRSFSFFDSLCDVADADDIAELELDGQYVADRLKVRARYDEVSRGALSFGLMENSFRAYRDYQTLIDLIFFLDSFNNSDSSAQL